MMDAPEGLPDLAPAVAAVGLPGSLHAFPDHPLDPQAWARLLARAREQRLAGLLLSALDDGSLPSTEDQREAAATLHVEQMRTVLHLEAELLDAIDALRQVGVDVRVIKGSAVAHLDYPDPALRAFVDVDLLVRGSQFDLAVAALLRAGHTRRFPQPRPGFDARFSKGASFKTPRGAEIDLHRTFVMGPFGLDVVLDDLWKDSPEIFTVADVELPALSRECRLMHACYHAALGDVVARLVPQRDVAQLLLSGRLDRDRVRFLLERWRAQPVVALAVRTTWATLALADIVALSAWAHRYIPSPKAAQELALYHDPQARYAEKSLAAVRAIPSWRDRVAFVRALAFPDADYLQGRPRGVARLRRAALARSRSRNVQ